MSLRPWFTKGVRFKRTPFAAPVKAREATAESGLAFTGAKSCQPDHEYKRNRFAVLFIFITELRVSGKTLINYLNENIIPTCPFL